MSNAERGISDQEWDILGRYAWRRFGWLLLHRPRVPWAELYKEAADWAVRQISGDADPGSQRQRNLRTELAYRLEIAWMEPYANSLHYH